MEREERKIDWEDFLKKKWPRVRWGNGMGSNQGVCAVWGEEGGVESGGVVWGWEGEMLIGWMAREDWNSHLQPSSPPWRRFVLFLFTIHNSGQLSCQNMWPTFVKSANKWGANICYVKVVEASGRRASHSCWCKKWTITDYSGNLKIFVSISC